MNPQVHDRILDVGCGTGQLALAILRRQPRVQFVGIDPDEHVLTIAKTRISTASADAELACGFLDDAFLRAHGRFTKVVSSLVIHQVSPNEKPRILSLMYHALLPSGELFIADYAEQPTWLMRRLFRHTVQRLDGQANTEPNVHGILSELMRDIGFTKITVRYRIPTSTGAISIFRAQADGPRSGVSD